MEVSLWDDDSFWLAIIGKEWGGESGRIFLHCQISSNAVLPSCLCCVLTF